MTLWLERLRPSKNFPMDVPNFIQEWQAATWVFGHEQERLILKIVKQRMDALASHPEAFLIAHYSVFKQFSKPTGIPPRKTPPTGN